MRKFVFMLIAFLVSVGLVNSAFGKSDKDETKTYYEEVCVASGETYWDIAGKYKCDGMTRDEYTEYIMEFNGAADENIKAGQKIIVPVVEYV